MQSKGTKKPRRLKAALQCRSQCPQKASVSAVIQVIFDHWGIQIHCKKQKLIILVKIDLKPF